MIVKFGWTAATLVAMLASSTTTTMTTTEAFTAGSFVGRPVVVPTLTRTPTSLSMNLFDRFSRVAKANIDSVLKKWEDPEKVMNQAVEDMQKDLVKVRQSYAEVTATQRRLMKQKEQAEAMAADWYQRAQLALKKGADDLAREALTRRQAQMDQVQATQEQLDLQAANIDKLYEGMQALESKILDAKAKKEQIIARARTAESTQKVNDMLGGITGQTSMDAFNKMEEKVEAMEAAAEVSAEMSSNSMLPGSAASDLDKEFKLLEGSAAVDDELKKLKGLLAGTPDEASGGGGASAGGDVEDELERLKKDAGL